MKTMLTIGLLAVMAAGCKGEPNLFSQHPAPSTPTELRVQCGCCLTYNGPSPVPDEFWKKCDRAFDLDNKSLDAKIEAKRAVDKAGKPTP